MELVLTLVANPTTNCLIEEAEQSALVKLSGEYRHTTVLSKGKANDLFFQHDNPMELFKQISDTLGNIDGLDWCLQPVSARRKKLLLADMDSTMITVECIDELADFVGLKDKVSAITEAAMRGELNFEAALTERVALLAGLGEEKLLACYNDRITLMPGARALVQTMKANGAYSALVSGGFTYFTNKVAKTIGFDMNHANILELKNGSLTGKVVLPICGASTKLETLQRLAQERGLEKADILAVGDGANDIPMIEAAGLGVAYHAKPKTQAAASAAVRYNDLTALLYYQGYSDAEIIF